jgi:hypothetical protein
MPTMHMDPAKTILDLIGYEKAAEVTGKHISRVYRWTYPSGVREGTGGIIPHADAIKLLAYARTERLPLDEAAFMRAPSIVPEPEQQGAA